MKLYRGSCAVNWLPAGPLSAPWSAHADLFLPTEMKTLQYRSASGPYILLTRSVDALMGSNTLRLIADPRHDVTASAVNTGIWKTHANQDGGGFCCREMWNIQKTENISESGGLTQVFISSDSKPGWASPVGLPARLGLWTALSGLLHLHTSITENKTGQVLCHGMKTRRGRWTDNSRSRRRERRRRRALCDVF